MIVLKFWVAVPGSLCDIIFCNLYAFLKIYKYRPQNQSGARDGAGSKLSPSEVQGSALQGLLCWRLWVSKSWGAWPSHRSPGVGAEVCSCREEGSGGFSCRTSSWRSAGKSPAWLLLSFWGLTLSLGFFQEGARDGVHLRLLKTPS